MKLPGSFIDRLNRWGGQSRPFLFIIDFEGRDPMAWKIPDIPGHVRFTLPGQTVQPPPSVRQPTVRFQKHPVSFAVYEKSFDRVREHIRLGNSYLVNLTFPTPIETNLDPGEIFERSRASYKLLVNGSFVVFSPEPFIRIDNGRIRSFPMKGTIDASHPSAAEQVLSDPKETAEHNTIVDLIRNDLSKVANQVTVSRFRYIDRLRVHEGEILQVSSEITGVLPGDYPNRIGDILADLLPAGSISGAPKDKTLEIIREAEPGPRGFYTGVFGCFDGRNLDSAVMIRFIEQTPEGLVYRSGGGITHLSRAADEYAEMVRKVYLAMDGDTEGTPQR